MNRRLTSVLLVATLTGAVLAGCAPAPEVSASAAEQLQTSVRLVADQAAAGDTAAAVGSLDALQAQLDAAVASEGVSDERAQTVQAKIDLVRADLAQRIADAEASAAAVEAKRIEDEKAAIEAQRVIDEQAEAQRLADEKAARDDDKPGNGNGPKNKDEEEDEE